MATKLIVTGLTAEFTEACLYDLFDLYGAIVDVALTHQPANEGLLGEGFVVFENASDAARARRSMDGATVGGRTLAVYEEVEVLVAPLPPSLEPRVGWEDGAFS